MSTILKSYHVLSLTCSKADVSCARPINKRKTEYSRPAFNPLTAGAEFIRFLSPARRGRGILVAPGFCQASGVTFSCGRKN